MSDEELARLLRDTTERMACFCSVDMTLWSEHSNAALATADRIEALAAENAALREALSAACGYLLNAKIDLETGARKSTAIATIEGGLRRVRSALQERPDGETLVEMGYAREWAGRREAWCPPAPAQQTGD